MSTLKMKEVKIAFYPQQLEALDREAAAQGISRSQLVRESVTGTSASIPTFNRQSYLKAVEAAAKAVTGLPRAQVEHMAARVINTLAT